MDKDIKNAFSDSNGFGEFKPFAVKLMDIFLRLLDKYNVNYFLISGTLLGYIRHNDFIPWDDDIDIIVSSDFLTHYSEIEKEAKFLELKMFTITNNAFYKISYEKKFIANSNGPWMWPFIDIFIYGKTTDKLKFFNQEWDATKFFPYKNVPFNGILARIPNDPHYFLQKNYNSNYMQHYISSCYNHKKERPLKKVYNISTDDYKKLKN